jgi:hypothetical protein
VFFFTFFTYKLLQVCWCFTEIQFSVLFSFFYFSFYEWCTSCPVFGKRLNEIERLNTKYAVMPRIQ